VNKYEYIRNRFRKNTENSPQNILGYTDIFIVCKCGNRKYSTGKCRTRPSKGKLKRHGEFKNVGRRANELNNAGPLCEVVRKAEMPREHFRRNIIARILARKLLSWNLSLIAEESSPNRWNRRRRSVRGRRRQTSSSCRRKQLRATYIQCTVCLAVASRDANAALLPAIKVLSRCVHTG